MSYIIYRNDGTVLSVLGEKEIDNSSCSLTLIGKNTNDYGEYFNTNFIKLLTNFSSNTSDQPISPQVGQLWFDSTTRRLKVYTGNQFAAPYGVEVSGTANSTPSEGDLWYDTANSQLKIYFGEFKLIAPAVSGLLGKFGIEPPPYPILEDDTLIQQDASVLYSYGNTIGLIASQSFIMSADDSLSYFNTATITNVSNGLTLINDIDVKGDLHIKNIKQVSPIRTLTSYYDITLFNDPTNSTNIENANLAIATHLAKVFNLVDDPELDEVAYPIGSDARVTCNHLDYGISVRRFKVVDDPLHPGTPIWKSYDVYSGTNIV
jgi:hypothetical protein